MRAVGILLALVLASSDVAMAHPVAPVCPTRTEAQVAAEARTVVVATVVRATRDQRRRARGRKPAELSWPTRTIIRVDEVLRGEVRPGARVTLRGIELGPGAVRRHAAPTPRLVVGARVVLELSEVVGRRAAFASCGARLLTLPASGDDPDGQLARWRAALAP